ncbi:iron-containing alcohol dehydrogenase [Allosaccharopolyspora coralli]|uniref:Iron-containing alcohol dehydrogenase n=2 Tax=Allosaccharopolyspora coralli TaxID=2665642 RepID=A0A5Q3QBM5_9PSEU|nr:iron-containing alcohol dehydrogenase [Allosaccharopolyspora coralli]
MSLHFDHVTLGQRVRFGTNRAADNLAAEVNRLGAERVMVIAAPTESAIADSVTGHIDVAVRHDDVAPHVPLDKAAKARAVASDNGIDLLVCIGGGSTTGLAKAVAMTTALPIVAVPTTYAGSEATNVWGLTESARKTTGVDDTVLPTTVIYDAALTLSLPVELSIASGLNGMAHCIDSMWAPRADPINQAMAGEGIRALANGLPALRQDPHDLSGREQTLYGAYLSAVAFASAGSGLHHKICHVLGGAYNLPHAETHATVLPYVLAFNGPAAPEAEARIATAFGAAAAIEGLDALRDKVNAPRALQDHGMAEEAIPEAAELILPAVPESNPRPVREADLDRLLRAAHTGAAATTCGTAACKA